MAQERIKTDSGDFSKVRTSRRTATSCAERHAAFTFGCKSKASLNVLGRQIGKIIENLWCCHTTAQIIQNVSNRDAGPFNARLATADKRINCDTVLVRHSSKLRRRLR